MTYYFYDTETSGLSAKWQRIMQFAGIRTDEEFNEIGEPDNWLVKLTPDVLPEPEAILITGITPQQTLLEGYSEPEFADLLMKQIFTPGTTALGYNSIRFDDEFIRYTLYRNFFDPYEREWSDDRGRWDIVDMVRMTRALRPEGIVWPVSEDGRPTNRLEKLSVANGVLHDAAHDALSDVRATIGIAKLLRDAQPKLFEHLSSLQNKKAVARFLEQNKGRPLVHSSSKFSSDFLGTSVVVPIVPHPTNPNAVLVFDLRHSPKQFADFTPEELAEAAFTPYKQLAEKDKTRLPIKAVHLNKSPALAPMGVLDEESQARIQLTISKVETHLKELAAIDKFGERVGLAWESNSFEEESDVDAMLYSSFLNDSDRKLLQQVRNRKADDLAGYHPNFIDERMNELLLRYKARNFPTSLDEDEKQLWEQYRAKRLQGSIGPQGLQAYQSKLAQLAQETKSKEKLFLLEELQLYAQSIAPYENEELL